MKYTIHAGHAKQGNKFSGASGIVQESIENRKIKNAVIKYLQQAGQETADCTVDSGSSQSAIITAIKKKINACDGTTANISIHLNCFNGKAEGTECEVSTSSNISFQYLRTVTVSAWDFVSSSSRRLISRSLERITASYSCRSFLNLFPD